MKKFRITAISDTHTYHRELTLPGGDILIHSGDFTSIGRKDEVEDFIGWLSDQPYKYKVFIAGNHDIVFDSERKFRVKSEWIDRHIFNGYNTEWVKLAQHDKPHWLKTLLGNLKNGVHYLENSSVCIEGINIWGSPYSPSFGSGWGFNSDRGYDMNEHWNLIPMDTHILITHTPMYGYNDRTLNTNENVGCADLYHRVREVKPHLHFCGHIHEGMGHKVIGLKDWYDCQTFNSSNLNIRYECVNPPINFDYNFDTAELEFHM
jgi:Icc-related predicted phosphoesterase